VNSLDLSTFFDLSKVSFKDLFKGCTYPWEALQKLPSYVEGLKLGKIHPKIPSNATIVNEEGVHIGEGSIVEPGAYIEGPCYIGKHCLIKNGSYIRSHALIDDHVLIGHCTEVKSSIFLPFAKAPHFNYVGDSIVGNDVNLGAGLICANLRIDNEEVIIHFQGQKLRSGLRKFGAIIGDGCKLGCNCVINPGTLLEPKSVSRPCESLRGIIEK